jgi:alkyl sulfatase BDS1-like metallo-beta-lactamase superfamily hydrolase
MAMSDASFFAVLKNHLPSVALGAVVAISLASVQAATLETNADRVSPATARTQLVAREKEPSEDKVAMLNARRGFIARPSGQVHGPNGNLIWDFDSFGFIEGEAPDTAHPGLWRQAGLNNQIGLFKVVDGIYQLRGFDLANMTLIEGHSGWIVVDTLTSRETAAHALAFARQYLGDRPVSAIIFTHSHVDHFGGALGVISPQEVSSRKIPVVAPIGFVEEATSENMLMGPAMARRASYTYGSRLERSPTGLIDDGLGKAIAFGTVGLLPPNVLVTGTPQAMTIDGVRFVFYLASGSEAPSELTFFLPELKAYCGAETVSQTMHNLYTLRGAKVRDALLWAGMIDDAIEQSAQAEVYFGQHHWPVWGHENIEPFLIAQRDVYLYTHDQTVRLMNLGYNMNEIAEQLRLPPALDQILAVHGYYGTLRHNVKAVYQNYLGWFDGNPAHLDPLPSAEAGRRYVDLAGGPVPLMAAAQKAYDAGDFRWAAELLDHLVSAQPNHHNARMLLARTYEQLGFVSESATWRNLYLSGAQELAHDAAIPELRTDAYQGLLQQVPTSHFLTAMAASINGAKASSQHLKINLVISDTHESFVLELSNGVLHHRASQPAADASATLTVTHSALVRLMTGQAHLGDFLFGDELKTEGSRRDLLRLSGLLDKPKGNFPLVTRP